MLNAAAAILIFRYLRVKYQDKQHQTPLDNQIRTLLDATPPEAISPIFSYFFNVLDVMGVVDQQCSELGLLVAFDGVEYFSSNTIHCEINVAGNSPKLE